MRLRSDLRYIKQSALPAPSNKIHSLNIHCTMAVPLPAPYHTIHHQGRIARIDSLGLVHCSLPVIQSSHPCDIKPPQHSVSQTHTKSAVAVLVSLLRHITNILKRKVATADSSTSCARNQAHGIYHPHHVAIN